MFKYVFADGVFTFHKGTKADGTQIVFRVRIDNTPEKRSKEHGNIFISIIPATEDEIMLWRIMPYHYKNFPVLKII